MHRNRTWTLDPPEWRTQRNRLLPIEGGDGSTLNLDFTTGVLDPRLTFTRASSATFVNSQGYVQYADSNELKNSTMLTASNWTQAATGGSPSVTINGDNTVTFASVAGIATWLQGISIVQGLPISFSLEVTALTNTDIRVSDMFSAGFGFTGQVYKYTNPSGVTSTLGALDVLTGIGLYTVTATTTGTYGNLIFGTGCNGFNKTGSITIARPQVQYGTVVPRTAYVPNASTSLSKYDAPRFDYSPTNIGEPRGLLIEGQTQNVLYYSQDVTQATRWTIQGGIPSSYTSVSATGGTAPDNTNTANLCTESTANNSRSIYQGLTAVAGTYTASVWVKAGTGSTRYIRLVLPSAAGNFVYVTVNISTGAVTQAAAAVGTASAASATVTPYPGSWYHIRLTGTLAAAVNFVFIVPLDSATPSVNTGDYGREAYLGNGSTFLIWGAQLESGSGASSYIPTGASQVTRSKDSMTLSDLSALGISNTAGTLITDFTNSTENSNFAANISFRSAVGSTYAARFRWASNALLTTYFQSNGTTGFTTNLNGSRTSFTRCRAATSYSYDGTTTSVFGSMNGAAMSTTSTTTQAASIAIPTSLRWNDDGSTPSAADYSSLVMRSVKYYPSCLTIAQMNVITSPNYVAPTLDIDFTLMTTGADLTAKGITFTRLTNATFINTAGDVQFSDANLLSDSESFLTGWTDNGLITPVATESITNPIGTTGAVKLVINESGGSKSLTQNLSVTAGFQYTFRVWVKAATSSAVSIGYYNGGFYNCTLTKISGPGTISGSGTGTVYQTITGLSGSEWTQVQVVLATVGTGGNGQWYIYPNTPGGVIGDSIYIWGAQCNIGATANPYYKTTTAAYQAPRFNNAVLTSRANYIKQSNNFAPTTWTQKDGTHLATVTAAYEAAPPGFTGTATRITSSNSAAGITQALNVPLVSGKTIRMSFYAKSNTVTPQNCMLQSNSSTFAVITIPTTWTRIDEIAASAVTEITLKGFMDPLDISIYGMQVEYVTSGGATDYIPTTTIGAIRRTTKPRGILIEQNTENLSLYSNTLYGGTWGNSAGITRSQDTLLPDPSGSNNACQITKDNGVQYVVVNQAPIPTFTVPATSTRYLTASVWLRVATSGQVPSIGIFDAGGTGFGTRYDARTNNDLVTIASGSTADIDITFGSVLDWVRVSVTRAFTNTTASPISYNSLALYIYPNRQNSNAATIYAWGTQMELTSGPTTYVPTVGSASLRSLESCYLVGANFTSWYNIFNPAGTFYTEFDRPEASSTAIGNPVPIGFGDYAPGKLIMMASGESAINTGMFLGIWTNVNFFSGNVTGATTRKENNKAAFAFSTSSVRGSLNTTGLSAVITGAGSMNTKEVLYIGSNGTITANIPAGSRDWLNSSVQRVVFYPTEFTPTQLTAIVS